MNIDQYRDMPLVRGYIQYLRLEKGFSGNTLSAYLEDLGKLLGYLLPGGVEPEKATPHMIEDFMMSLSDVGISARSVARIMSGVKSFYRYLLLSDVIDKDPCGGILSPRLGDHLPQVLSIEEIDAMEQAVDRSKWQGVRDYAMLETLYSCGLRVSELVGLKFSDINRNEMYLNIVGKGNKQRLVPLSSRALEAIEEWEVQRNENLVAEGKVKDKYTDTVFLNYQGTQLSRISVFKVLKQLAALAGVQKEISPHTLRHSFATHLLDGGANLRDIQDMLGHSSISTTEIYARISIDALRENILQCHPLYRGELGGHKS